MTPKLIKLTPDIYHFVDGKCVDGPHAFISGNVSNIRGNVSNIRGNVSGIRGNVSGIRGDMSNISGDVSYIRGNVSNISGYVGNISGDVSGIRGNVSGISGDVDECELTDEDRKAGVDIASLIVPDVPVKQKVTLELTDEQLAKIRKLLDK